MVKIEPLKAKPIWDRWSEYEYQYGDFAAAQRLAARYSEAFPEGTCAPLLALFKRIDIIGLSPIVSPLERFTSRHGYAGLDESIADDLGILPPTLETLPYRQHNERSPSPSRINKRRPSAEPFAPETSARDTSPDRGNYSTRGGDSREQLGNDGGVKRLKQYHRDSASPAPLDDRRGPPPPPREASGWGRVPKEEIRDDFDGRSRRREEPQREVPPAQILHMLDPRGDVTGPLPDGVLFFLSILPSSASFNGKSLRLNYTIRVTHRIQLPTGPILDPLTVVEVISGTILPGSAPGGFAGERLGIPPRRKPASSGYQQGDGGRERERERSPSPGPYRAGGGGGGDRGKSNTHLFASKCDLMYSLPHDRLWLRRGKISILK